MELVTYRLEGPVAVIGLNRPDKRNAINNAVIEALRLAVLRAGDEAPRLATGPRTAGR